MRRLSKWALSASLIRVLYFVCHIQELMEKDSFSPQECLDRTEAVGIRCAVPLQYKAAAGGSWKLQAEQVFVARSRMVLPPENPRVAQWDAERRWYRSQGKGRCNPPIAGASEDRKQCCCLQERQVLLGWCPAALPAARCMVPLLSPLWCPNKTVNKVTCSPHLNLSVTSQLFLGLCASRMLCFLFCFLKEGGKDMVHEWRKPLEHSYLSSVTLLNLIEHQIFSSKYAASLPAFVPLLWRDVISWVFCRGTWLMQCLFWSMPGYSPLFKLKHIRFVPGFELADTDFLAPASAVLVAKWGVLRFCFFSHSTSLSLGMKETDSSWWSFINPLCNVYYGRGICFLLLQLAWMICAWAQQWKWEWECQGRELCNEYFHNNFW